MKDEDVKVGMKVIPYLKLGNTIFEDSSIEYMNMLKNNLKYLYVARILKFHPNYKKTIYVLSNTVDGTGDYFYSSDFEYINLQRKQKLIKLYSKNER